MKRKILNNSKGVYEFITSIINKIKESFNKKKEKRRNKRIESLRETSETIQKMMNETPHPPESEDDIERRFVFHLFLFPTGSISESGFSLSRFEKESLVGILNISGDTYRLTVNGRESIKNLYDLYVLSRGP